MSELWTEAELERVLRDEVEEAGGAKKWLRKKKMLSYGDIDYMVANGQAATLPAFLNALGFRAVTCYERRP